MSAAPAKVERFPPPLPAAADEARRLRLVRAEAGLRALTHTTQALLEGTPLWRHVLVALADVQAELDLRHAQAFPQRPMPRGVARLPGAERKAVARG